MKVFSLINLKTGHYQVSLAPETRFYTSFQVEGRDKCQYTYTPQGLSASSPEFLKLMELILSDFLYKNCYSYVYDILIHSKTMDEHIIHLREFFLRLRYNSLKINTKKWEFGRGKVKFVGFIISSEGIAPNPDKINKIKELVTPTNQKALMSFLGLGNY